MATLGNGTGDVLEMQVRKNGVRMIVHTKDGYSGEARFELGPVDEFLDDLVRDFDRLDQGDDE